MRPNMVANHPFVHIARGLLMTVCVAAGAPAFAGTIEFKDCSAKDESNIRSALAWLKSNMPKVDERMGKNKLMAWKGSSRSKFVARLDKKLRFVCKNDEGKCKLNKDGMVLLGNVVPTFMQRTVKICTNNFFSGQANYVGTLAHEIAHLVRLNPRQTNCRKKYEKPRFSLSVGLAAYHAFNDTTYSASDYTKYCK